MTNLKYQRQQQYFDDGNRNSNSDSLFDRKIDLITAGLQPRYNKLLKTQVSRDNAISIYNYITAMKLINISDNYKTITIRLLIQFSKFHKQKPFEKITRDDVLSYLDSLRRTDDADPLHKWIGTYNIYNVQLTKFFKWFYAPDIESDKRQKPKVVENIPKLRRKEKSIYKHSDLWTEQEDLLFLKFCPSSRIRCYHTIGRDTGCRLHEILKLKIKDVVFKSFGTGQYAEINVNGKTGDRTLPLIDSIPYLKEYLSNGMHPQPNNPNAPLICGENRSYGRHLRTASLYHVYERYKKDVYPKLLESPNVTPEDKQKLRELLKKPWNPYLAGRHTSLTAKSKILPEATLRVFSGWTASSDMPRRYVHLLGNAACEDLLEEYGLVDKNPNISVLQSKQCPNCNNPNRPDARFCVICKLVLSYEAYEDALDNQQHKDDALAVLSDQVMKLTAEVEELKNQRS